MSNWMDGPEPTELEMWKMEIEESYEEYKSKCPCNSEGECECMTLDQFEENALNEIEEYWEEMDEPEFEERWA